MPAAYRAAVISLLACGLGVALSGCAGQQASVQTVAATAAPEDPDAPPVSRWQIVRGKPNTRQATNAVLPGVGTTTRILGEFRALLAVRCHSKEPQIRIAYPVTVGYGG